VLDFFAERGAPPRPGAHDDAIRRNSQSASLSTAPP
jgi:hypothetical protein